MSPVYVTSNKLKYAKNIVKEMTFCKGWIVNEIMLRNNYFFSLPPRVKREGRAAARPPRKGKRK